MNTPRSPTEPRSAMTWPDAWAAVPPPALLRLAGKVGAGKAP